MTFAVIYPVELLRDEKGIYGVTKPSPRAIQAEVAAWLESDLLAWQACASLRETTQRTPEP